MEEKKKSRKSEKPSSAIEPTVESTSTPSKVTGFLDDNIVQFLSERERLAFQPGLGAIGNLV
jgi:hypothetical protein